MKIFRWGSRALDMFPEGNALHKTYNFEGKVIIIGAGASGLAAAKILQGNKIDYLILEASNRYGEFEITKPNGSIQKCKYSSNKDPVCEGN